MKNLKGLAALGVCIGMLLCPLGGCAPRGGGLSAASGSRSEPDQPPLSSSSQQEALKEKIPPKILMTGEVRWTSDSQYLVMQNGDTLEYYNRDSQREKTVKFDLPKAAGESDDPTMSWNDDMVFIPKASSEEQAPCRVMVVGGKRTLVNAGIYTAQGELIKEFPRASAQELAPLQEAYERSISQNVERVYWLNNDQFVIDTKARVLIYSISSDELTVVSDMTEAVRGGYTIENSWAFGTHEHWVDQGKFYYAANTKPLDVYQKTLLYVIGEDNQPRQIFKEEELPPHPMYKVENGLITVYEELRLDYDLSKDGFAVWYANTQDYELKKLGDIINRWEAKVNFDGRYFSYSDMDIRDTLDYTKYFHCYDLQTGEDIVLTPEKVETDTPKQNKTFEYTLMDVDTADPNNLKFIYGRTDILEEGSAVYTKSDLQVHEMGSGIQHNYGEIYDLGWSWAGESALSPDKTAVLNIQDHLEPKEMILEDGSTCMDMEVSFYFTILPFQ